MSRLASWLRWTLVVGLVAIAGAAAAIWLASERKLRATYEVPPVTLAITADAAAVARGEHIVTSVAGCTTCHGADLGGKVYGDMGWLGIIAGPNLTRGNGGVGRTLTERDWVRAIRFGVRRDGTSLIAMPSEVFTYLTDADLGAVIAFLRQAPPVDRTIPRTRFGFGGRALLALGRLNLLVAPKTARGVAVAAVEPGPTAAYGKYLADVAGCHGCHGYGLSGGRVAGPPSLPPASNLTPEGLGGWTEADFIAALRSGRRPDGRPIDEFMPWKAFRIMTDVELRALWRYLQSVPPKPFGNK